MKINVLFFALVAFTISVKAQSLKPKTLYYGKDWLLVSKNNATYYRTCTLDTANRKFVGEIRDYTIDGKLLMTGSYKSEEKKGSFASGLFTFYYPNGQIESQGNFEENVRSGVWNYFYPNGNQLRQLEFSDKGIFVNYQYDSAGNLQIKDGTGPWKYEYEWVGVSQKFIVIGNFLNGKKDGEWICKFDDGTYLYKEVYSKGKWKSGYYTNADGSLRQPTTEPFQNEFFVHYKFEVTEKFSHGGGVSREDYPFLSYLPSKTVVSDSISNKDKVFLVVESPPDYEGGMEVLHRLVAKNIKYPLSARRMNIEGTVLVRFIIEPDGSISEAKVIKGISADCDKEALRIVGLMTNWIPGKQQGKPVRVAFVYPIKFMLD